MKRMNNKNTIRRHSINILALLAILLLLAAWPMATLARGADQTVPVGPLNFSVLAENASPAVVNIRTVKTTRDDGRVFRFFSPGPFGGREDHFRDFFDRFFEGQPQRERKQRSLGSGFIIDRDGHIVTNNHVIEDADEILVILKNGDEYPATIVGRDANTDLALIRVDAQKELPVLDLGDSDALKVGQWVMAIGNPFGLEHTVTAGIVSAKGRVIGSGPYDDFIQTDASINPGNSGGPLLDLDGRVVGINTAIVAGGQGIGFAIPINMARNIIEQITQHGEVIRGWLGVAIQSLTREMAQYYGLDDPRGVLVTEVFAGDPADKAGIRPQDIILRVNNREVENSRDLTRMIADIQVGETAKIEVLRDGKRRTFDVTIAKRLDERVVARGERPGQEDELGITVETLTDEIAKRLNLPDTQGVVVSAVTPDSQGALAGVQRGDVIKEINRKAVKNPQDYTKAVAAIKTGQTLQMLIWRTNAGFIVVSIER